MMLKPAIHGPEKIFPREGMEMRLVTHTIWLAFNFIALIHIDGIVNAETLRLGVLGNNL